MVTRASQLRELALECRAIAALVKHPEIREQLLEVAEQFERVAGIATSSR
jgi:hypothetical protein